MRVLIISMGTAIALAVTVSAVVLVSQNFGAINAAINNAVQGGAR